MTKHTVVKALSNWVIYFEMKRNSVWRSHEIATPVYLLFTSLFNLNGLIKVSD